MARRTLLGVALATAALGGCSAGAQGLVQVVNDTVLTSTVKQRLAAEEGVGTLQSISVETREDRVTLSGTVPDAQARARIETLVRDIAGANRVTSELRVREAAQARSR